MVKKLIVKVKKEPEKETLDEHKLSSYFIKSEETVVMPPIDKEPVDRIYQSYSN